MKKLIITGNYSEYKEVCKNLKLDFRKDAIYINSISKLRGQHIDQNNVIFGGSYESKENIGHLIMYLSKKRYFHNRYMKNKYKTTHMLLNFFTLRTFVIAIIVYVIIGFIYINTK